MKHTQLSAYEVVQQQEVPDLQSFGTLLRHKKSGARVLLLENEDENKVFTIGFRTPPEDSTGLPHILEHSVLCGSKKFPAKDPFVELVKGSLNTFLNAMTYPDKTLYPIASCNGKDFQNLMHVYMDAVFYPNIYERDEIFRQEGWSYKLDSKDGVLEYNGVVYNEMKGAFSSPEGVLDRVILNTLFPDTCYRNESGGDPEEIPNLTYGQFLAFHKKYYHPSNSYIYLYGDMDMDEKLEWLDAEYLSKFDKIEIDSAVRLQEPFAGTKEVEMEYSITSSESEEDNTYLSYNKVIGTSLDQNLYLAFQILDYALLSAPGAPLKKALVDAGIGKDILGSYDNGIYQPIFSVIAKNANVEQKEEFIRIIEDTLRDIVENGMDRKALAAGINYHEFRYREADFGNFPKGLMYGLQMFDSWLYDDEKPFIHVEELKVFEFLKQEIEHGYFEGLIKEYLLDNTHAAIVVIRPEKGRTARLDKELAEKLQAYKDSLSEEEVTRIVADTEELLAYQEEPSTKEELEAIPVLGIADISKEIAPIQNEELRMAGVPVVHHDVETNGISYLSLMFDLSNVSAEELPYVGILQSVLGMIDTTNYAYGELFNEINVHTGGIGTSLELYPNVERAREKEFRATFEVKTKAMYDKLAVAFDMMGELLLESKFEDYKRLEEILALLKSRLQMKFQSSGHTTAVMRAMSYRSPMSRFKDMTGGIAFYERVCDIAEHFEQEKESLAAHLRTLSGKIFRGDNLMLSCTSTRDGLDGLESLVAGLKDKLYKGAVEQTPCILNCEQKNEGFKTASKVQYVARTGNFIEEGLEYTGALQILKVILSYDYLWQNVRVKGGAYGCMSNFNRVGNGYFVSYRDPNLEKTNEIYEGITEYLRTFDVDERDMTKYIIGTISNMDIPMTPMTKGERSMNLYMNHVSREMIEQERREVLTAGIPEIRALADIVAAVLKSKDLCVVGSEEKIEANKEMFGEIKNLA